MLEGKNNWKAWLYLAPALILLGIFSFYPIINSFIIAFIRDYHPVSEVFRQNVENNQALGLSFFTFKNFITVFKNANFEYAIKNTLLIALVSVPISVILALVISVLLISIKKLRGFFQTLFFLPYVTSAMAVAMAFTVLFANNGTASAGISQGPINSVIDSIGLKNGLTSMLDWMNYQESGKESWQAYICVDSSGEIDEDKLSDKYQTYVNLQTLLDLPIEYGDMYAYQTYLADQTDVYNSYRYHFRELGYIDWVGAQATWGSAILVVLTYSIWASLAFKILVFTGGLTSIDKQYYDAAKIDGTSKWRTFWRITVPMMSPLIVYILITSLIGAFKVYTSIVGLFGSGMGPAGSAGLMQTFVGLVYQYLNEGNELIHVGAAAAVILFTIILIITALTNALTKKRVHY